jgi:hypothetical protein
MAAERKPELNVLGHIPAEVNSLNDLNDSNVWNDWNVWNDAIPTPNGAQRWNDWNCIGTDSWRYNVLNGAKRLNGWNVLNDWNCIIPVKRLEFIHQI